MKTPHSFESKKPQGILDEDVVEDVAYTGSQRTRWIQKFIYYLKDMRIEPALLIYMVSSVLGNIIASDLQLDRACRINVKFNDSICDRLMQTPKPPNLKQEELAIQEVVSEIGIWGEFVENFFPILFAIFLGSWSDTYGTKLPFLLSIFGVILRYAGLILCVYNDTWNAESVAAVSLVPSSVTGGRIAISMVVYSYIAVTTSVADRTARVGILTAVRTFGRSAGSALGGHLKRSGRSYYFIFGIGGGLAIVAFLYALLLLPNRKRKNLDTSNVKISKQLRDIFDLKHILVSAKAFLKPRPFKIHFQLFLLVVILIFTMAPMQGEDSVLNLFVRNKLGWSTADYAQYSANRMLIAFAGGIASTAGLIMFLGFGDWVIGVASCFSQIAGSIIYAFAHNELMMYIAPVVDILNGTMIIAARAMISKIIPMKEQGKVNAFVAVIDSTTPLWGNPTYNALYRGTLDTFPGAFFLLSVAFTIPPLILFIIFGLAKWGTSILDQAKRHGQLEEHATEDFNDSSSNE